MNRLRAALRGQPERTVMLGTILLASVVSGAASVVLSQYFSVDVFSSLVGFPRADCFRNWGIGIGGHCFSDYAMPVDFGLRANPWDPYPLFMPPNHQPSASVYPPAGMVPQVAFGLLGKWLGMPQVGLFGYLLVLTIAVFVPAIWAARGARGVGRVVVFVACGALAVPAWTVIDRGNAVALAVPIALVFLVALCRQRWGLVAVMVVLAALVKPQFAVLVIALPAARQWRLSGIAVVGVVVSNLASYLLWPKDFPATIMQSVHNALGYSGADPGLGPANVSFTRAILLIPDTLATLSSPTRQLPDGYLAGPRMMLGYAILLLVAACVVLLGRRMPPVMVGIVLLATAFLFPALSMRYYLIFVLPIAAVVVRDPAGPPGTGIFERLAAGGRRLVGICLSLSVALTVAQIALPLPFQVPLLGPVGEPGMVGTIGTTVLVWTTAVFTPIFWLVTCAVIIVSYARRPASDASVDDAAPLTTDESASIAPS